MSLHTRLFVGNIPENIKDTDLHKAFSTYGAITNLEMKRKPGTENDQKRFAFITLSASNYDVEICIKNIPNIDFAGHRLFVSRARESFLERLQREREQASKTDEEKNNQKRYAEAILKENPIINLSMKLNTQKRKTDGYHLSNEEGLYKNPKQHKSKKEMSVGFDDYNRDINDKKESFEINNKKQNSEQKRLESLKRKRQEFKEKNMILKMGLVGIDKVQNKKIIFTDNEDEGTLHCKLNQETLMDNSIYVKKNTLFDDEESEDTEVNFEIKKQFEGKKGQKVLELQSRYKSDKRFTLDERFIDEDQFGDKKEKEIVNDDERIDIGQSDEKKNQLNILQEVLGVSIQPNNSDSVQKIKPKLGMLRYDPMHPDHAKFLAPITSEVPKKIKKKKSKEIPEEPTAQETIAEKIEVSKEQFYKISDTLKEAMIQPNTFSLRTLFAKEENDDEEQAVKNKDCLTLSKEKKRKTRNPLDTGEKNPFVYDSSDSEGEEDKKEITTVQEKPEVKAVWRENLFFLNNDCRLKEGLLFFNRSDESEGHKERRGLKSIMKKRIYNKERKNQMFKKKIGGRKKSMKKGFMNKR